MHCGPELYHHVLHIMEGASINLALVWYIFGALYMYHAISKLKQYGVSAKLFLTQIHAC